MHLYDQDHFEGDEICFAGDGLVQLTGYTLQSDPMVSWLGQVQGMEVGIEPVFVEGTLAPGVKFSWFYASGFSDDIGSDLPAGMTSLVITDGFDAIGACGSGTCGYVTASNGQIVVCGTGVCPNEQPCVANSCCIQDPVTACAGRVCGVVSDNCGNSVQCGSLMGACADAQRSCTSAGQCCYSQVTACGANECGNASDGCGNTYSCGTCPSGTSCSNGSCVGACKFHSCPSGLVWNSALCACQPSCHPKACQ